MIRQTLTESQQKFTFFTLQVIAWGVVFALLIVFAWGLTDYEYFLADRDATVTALLAKRNPDIGVTLSAGNTDAGVSISRARR